ncbi:MAG: protein kinase [Thermoanaerobaculaceae bacterium]|nr:protein kinase [Thermoanaerobaculaceae bacterium]TAM56441.1 MAG: serine/threonine-protein kinase [Acidobacteriota bacterium]
MKTGDRIGRFEVLGVLGAGGMGSLWRARDPKLGREVAIKLVAERFSDSREHQLRFEQEARAASALNHPNIITIYDVGEHDGFPYIAMELIEGQNLRDFVAERPRSMRRLVEVACQVADGLAAAHEQGIVHRDLKPENVMVTRRGFVKILDFGLAKLMPSRVSFDETTAEYQLATQAGMVVGTIGYMSPEQARGLTVDSRSDQFSFGTMLFEMLAGQRPFAGGTNLDTLSAILERQPDDLVRLDPKIPRALADVVQRCLAKDPDDRFASTRELAQALALIRDTMTDLGTATPAAARPRRRIGRTRALALLAAAAAVLAVAWFWLGRSRPAGVGPSGAARRVAVLPFRDLTGTPKGNLIGEGFAETVSARLGSDREVAVLPAAAIDETSDDLGAVVRRTGAQAVVRGSLQFEGDLVRATFAVIEADGVQLAAGRVEGSTAGLLDLEDEVARRAAAALGLSPAATPTRDVTSEVSADRFLEALGYLRRYEDEASVDAAIKILEELGGSARVQAALARAYLAKRSLTGDRVWAERAIAAGRRAAALDPALGSVRETRGRIELLLDQPAKAAAEFRLALAAEPNSVEAQLGLASALERQGLAPEAEAAYRRAIEIQPAWWSTYSHLGVFQLRRGSFAAALESFRAAVRLSPENTRAIGNLGIVYQQLGRYDEAITEYRRSIAIRPTASALSNLGTSLFFLARYDEAAKAYERATSLQPKNAVLWLNLGDALRLSGRGGERTGAAYRRAIDLLQADLALTPRDPDLRTSLALALAWTGQRAAALKQAAAALALDPEGPDTLYHVALVRLAGGDVDSALDLFARSIARGYPVAEMDHDPELARLKLDHRYAKMRASQAAQ